MNEGKELLYKIIDTKLKKLEKINKNDIIFDDVNLIDLLASLEKDTSTFADVSDELMEKVLVYGKLSRKQNLKRALNRSRDLLTGQRKYNIKVELSFEYREALATFITTFKNMIESEVPGAVNVETTINKCNELKHRIKNHELVSDYEFIESIVTDYDPIEANNNLIGIMKFICNHNLTIVKTPQASTPKFDLQYIRRPKLDDKIKEILSHLEIDYKELPNFLVGELKRCDVDDVYETFQLVKRNKAEEYGILHLINKDNLIGRLVLILYATKESIVGVVESLKDAKGNLDINLLRIVLNNTPTIFFEKNNEYFRPKYYSYMRVMSVLKRAEINYPSLVMKTPLFLSVDADALEYTLTYLEGKGANRKNIINRCYKTLAIDPSILMDNVNTMEKYHMDLNNFFGPNNRNYNLIKTVRLEKKIKWLMENGLLTDASDYDVISQLIVNKVYKDVTTKEVVWGA